MSDNIRKAEFKYMGRDLYWKLYDTQDGFIRWMGYDDANWWQNVAPTVRERTGHKSGRIYRIDFKTNAVEILPASHSREGGEK